MASTLTIRLDDDLYDKLVAAAAARGDTLSGLARDILSVGLADDEGAAANRGVGGRVQVPATLPSVQRHQLALLHTIAARLNDDDPDQARYHRDAAEAFNRGYTVEYSEVMNEVELELTKRDAELVMDILDMFTTLQSSIHQLEDAERSALGEDVLRRAEFYGFDLNSPYESRLLGYAKHALAQERWTNLAEYFDAEHERGNSHMRTVPVYERMLAEFRPIWREKIRKGDYQLSVDEIRTVADARIHPDNR